jgi:hypothetical protein
MAPNHLLRATGFSRVCLGIVSCTVVATYAAAQSNVHVPPGLYALTIQTVLPHLEEALRYATVKANRCLADDSADSFFPLLRHEAFSGCSLAPAAQTDTFTLHCLNPQAATGLARFERSADGIRAVLELKMGAKNMTLSQRVSGTRLGACG